MKVRKVIELLSEENEDLEVFLATYVEKYDGYDGIPLTEESFKKKSVQGRQVLVLIPQTAEITVAIEELTEALRLTAEYVGTRTLPPIEGWSWWNALCKYAPEKASKFRRI